MAKRLKLSDALEVLGKLYGKPRSAEHPDAPLLDHLLVGVLSAWVDREKAGRAARALSESFLDLNEARISPLAELTAVLEPSMGSHAVAGADAARTALQDVFDGTHGLDLEPLRGREPDDLRKFLRELPHTMGGPAASIFQHALGDRHLALMAPEARVLDRLGLLPRSATPAKVRQALEKQIRAPERLQVAWSLGSHAGAVCRAKIPACEVCTLLPNCKHGEEEMKQRAIDRKKEEARRAAEEKRRMGAEAKAARLADRMSKADSKKRAIMQAKANKDAAIAVKKAADKVAAQVAKKARADQAKREKAAAAAKKAADKKKAAKK